MEVLIGFVFIAILAIPGLALVAGGLALFMNAIERMTKK